MTELRQTLQEKDARLEAAQANELALRKRERELEANQREQELEIARRLDTERKEIQETVVKRIEEENRFRFAEKDQLVESLTKKIEDLKRQAQQGSLQAQGETLEICLEELLREVFPTDEITPVAKGQRGCRHRTDCAQSNRSEKSENLFSKQSAPKTGAMPGFRSSVKTSSPVVPRLRCS